MFRLWKAAFIRENRDSRRSERNGGARIDARKAEKLHEQGILTDDEFQQKKAELLAKM